MDAFDNNLTSGATDGTDPELENQKGAATGTTSDATSATTNGVTAKDKSVGTTTTETE